MYKKRQSTFFATVFTTALPGETFYFIVDGFSGETSGYSLEVTCEK